MALLRATRVVISPKKYIALTGSNFYHSGKGVYGHQLLSKPAETLSDTSEVDKNRSVNANLQRLVNAFRDHGHRIAHLNPLSSDNVNSREVSEINVARYHLEESQNFSPIGLLHSKAILEKGEISIREALKFLQQTYTNKIGYEFTYIENEAEREWFAERVEELSTEILSNDYAVQIGLEMAKYQNFDHFLANKFPNIKRYGGEGCETVVPFFLELLQSCSNLGVDHIVLGMAHRGRLNLLSGILKFPQVRMFQKMKGMPEFPPEARATGDVLSHLFTSVDLDVNGKNVHFSILPNPSHLEAVNPMAAGKIRSKMKTLNDYDYSDTTVTKASRAMCLQIHGDAALAGQGINQETLGFANVPHFRTSGSIHLVINNQVGFTTPQERGRSSRYTTDVAKMIGAPVIHINGDHPEDVVKGTKLAVEYRQKFHKDIFVDLQCFRRWGHNEMDDPTFTNPQIYSIIHSRESIPDRYNKNLIEEGILQENLLKQTIENHNQELSNSLKQTESYVPPKTYFQQQWANFSQADQVISTWDTGIEIPLLKYIGVKSVEFPENFSVHPHLLKTYIKSRISKVTTGTGIDWATAETLALGSLLHQGFGVRLSGEDVGRGTFSHRHVMLVDQKTGEMNIPLNNLTENQAEFLEVANSTLSEEAVLAFEYGYSIDNPNNLVIWEAQFGDFFNGAQIVIDTMISSGETKWMLQSGMVLLLPHGMDGAGPEHSSCKIERFLQMTDSNECGKVDGDYNNFDVVNPTTPAQYFHLLRRQMVRPFRKPLVVIAPKVLLRLSAATSTLEEFDQDTSFRPVLGDPTDNPSNVTKLIFVTGRHFYTLAEKREELKRKDVAIIRLESLCPFPAKEIQEEISKYKNLKSCIWSQEEHQNMGAWTFVRSRFENFVGQKIRYVGRGPLATPAVGVGQVHKQQVAQIIQESFAD